ncbi:MAG: (Fe-S)-binding protein [Acidobacteria bacterium]|nr:(Fe-S)-binding protein [Acidobacteriota bacterium]
MADSTIVSENVLLHDQPRQADLDRCVHCGLCLNACPTYRELGVEMDSPRGRVYQMVQVAAGRIPISDTYVEHIELCLACRACETACPSGVEYGKLVEAARAHIEQIRPRPLLSRLARSLVYRHLLVSPGLMTLAGNLAAFYQWSGLRRLVRSSRVLEAFGRLGKLERLMPPAERPFFFDQIGKTFPAHGERQHRVAFIAGCLANVSFSRLNEATVRVLQHNGCEVTVPAGQSCCGALHVHAGLRDIARDLARRNIEAFESGGYEAIVTNAAGCGSTLKEYGELLEQDPAWAERARAFSARVKDITEFLGSIDLNREMRSLDITVTYQDSCHLAHGQRVRLQPRQLLEAVPGLKFRELPLSDLCCGSAGVYNVQHNEMSMSLLEKKMQMAATTGADTLVTANPGCMLQLRAGAELFGRNQRVLHVVEVLDEAYGKR